MRLRLLVRRHNLPDAAVLWSVEDGENPTISQLLDQVNEIIPLESAGDWGLEDYAVEIRGSGRNFECLHFHLVRNILNEDDEILIRPLLSHDLKLRKVSGRHQISSDGRHLFDGWVFGRPRPQGPLERPAIEIPPRKRRRITYLEESDSSFDESPLTIESQARFGSDTNGNRQLILSADFEDDEDDDQDFEPNEDDEDDDDEEEEEGSEGKLNGYKNLLQDLSAMDSFEYEPDDEHVAGNIQKRSTPVLPRLCQEFPEVPRSVCDSVLISCDNDIKKARAILLRGFKRSTPKESVLSSSPDHVPSRTINTRSKTKLSSKSEDSHFISEKSQTSNDDDNNSLPYNEDTLLLQHYDQHGLPKGSIKSGKALSYMAKILSSSDTGFSDEPGQRASRTKATPLNSRSSRTVRFSDGVSGEDAPASIMQEGSDESEDEDFDPESNTVKPILSSDSSSAESGDNEETDQNFPDETSSSEVDSSSDSDTTSESDSDSDSDVMPDEISSKTAVSQVDVAPEVYTSSTKPQKEQKTSQKALVLPGQGKNATQARNRRRRMRNLLLRYQRKGILPAGTTVNELEQLKLKKCGKLENPTHDSGKLHGIVAAIDTEFEMRQQMLLDSLATGGVEVGPQPLLNSIMPAPMGPVSKQAEISETMVAVESETPSTLSKSKGTHAIEVRGTEDDADLQASAKLSGVGDGLGQSPTVNAEPTTAGGASRPRRKIDLGAAGRLLFGALGVRAPKNKEDHEKVRNELVKDIRRSKASVKEQTKPEVDGLNIDEDPEAWREVINLQAVECCYEGVELSPAPFPFVQRWDPEQQGFNFKQFTRGGKGKRKQRNQQEYYEDGEQLSNKRKRHDDSYDTHQNSYDSYANDHSGDIEGTSGNDEGGKFVFSSTSNMQDVYGSGIEGAVDEQIMRDVQEAATSQTLDEDDLPRLPDDISILANLSNEVIRPGMVIAFKQLVLSEATKWQPQMSVYRTAVLIKASESGNLELRLAKRDRERIEKYYDEETGERIYGKFDMPTEDDENEDEEDGFLEVTVDEIIEPKVVQLAPEGLDVSASLLDIPDDTTQLHVDNSTSPGQIDHSRVSIDYPDALVAANKLSTGPQDIGPSENDFSGVGRDSSSHGPDKIEALPILDNRRADIPALIKENGFQASTTSSVNRSSDQISIATRTATEQGAYSPKFNGLSHISSQYAPITSSPSHLDPITPLTEHSYEASVPNNDLPGIKSATSKVHDPELSIPSSLASRVSDRGHQPDYPIAGDDTLHQFDEMDSFPNTREEPLFVKSGYTQASRSSSVDKLPLNHNGFASDASSTDLPTLAEVFSTARSSVGLKHEQQSVFPQKTELKDAKKIEESYDKEMEALDAMLEAVEDPEHVTLNESVEEKTKSRIDSKSQFSIPPGSQKVDLTLSSDGEMVAEDKHSDESYDDAHGLPREPDRAEGKIFKRRRRRNNISQASSQRGTKTRNTRKKK